MAGGRFFQRAGGPLVSKRFVCRCREGDLVVMEVSGWVVSLILSGGGTADNPVTRKVANQPSQIQQRTQSDHRTGGQSHAGAVDSIEHPSG